MFKIVKNQKGSGLLYVLFFSMFLTTITLPLLQGSMLSFKSSISAMNKLTASNAVSEAYDIEMQTILSTSPDAHAGVAGTSTITVNGIPVSVNVTVNSTPAAYTDQEGDIEITAQATVNGTASRMWSQINYLNLANYALYCAESGGNVAARNGAVRTNALVFPRLNENLAAYTYIGNKAIEFNWPASYRECTGMYLNQWLYSYKLGWKNPLLVSQNGLDLNLTTAASSGFWGNLQQFLSIILNTFGPKGTM
ncbi:MAG: hypothetical protein KAR38_00695, partial [Calditrichia bacterium]|nr:hypothetical protein [Calditrichia bacterium]